MIYSDVRRAAQVVYALISNGNSFTISSLIAKKYGVGVRSFDSIFPTLCKGNIMKGRQGRLGGYQLTENGESSSLADLMRVVFPNAEEWEHKLIENSTVSIKEVALGGMKDVSIDDIKKGAAS